MLRVILLGLLLFNLHAHAQAEQCPETFPEECTCENKGPFGTEITCITVPLDTWNIQATFDEITDAINNNDTVINRVLVNGDLLGQEQEVPAHSISTLKAAYLKISGQYKFTRIDPEAFSGSHSTLEHLVVHGVNFTNPQEAFDLVNNFKFLQSFEFWGFPGFFTTLAHIPANALADDLPLSNIWLNEAGVTSIGDLAFAGPRLLGAVNLAAINLTLENISVSAFQFARQDVCLDLNRNPITHLAQEKFGRFLNSDSRIYVGGGHGNNDPQYNLHCDERVDWICDNGAPGIYGYYCKETEFEDIYDYCRQKFGFNPLTNRKPRPASAEHTDRVRPETLNYCF